MKILGLDEAGRGCVLGPLVVGAYCYDGPDISEVKNTGATDSKKLSAKKRQSILLKIAKIGTARLIDITPQEIDAGNINTLEEIAFLAHIIHFAPDVVYIDAPTHPRGIPAVRKRLEAELQKALPKLPELIIEPKADLNYPIVGAASIAAKVHRDGIIKSLGEVGSGYPSDPKTRKWLMGFIERNEKFPACVRTRWGTIEVLRQQRLL
jgi:ribonuclease HII